MNWYSFVFSEKKTHRLQRHFSFWLLWWAYFTTSYFHYEQAGLQKVEFGAWDLPFFIKSIMLLIIHITACYCFIDFLMPRYLFSAKYTALVTGVLFLGLLILLSSYVLHKTVFPLINAAFNMPYKASPNTWWTSITSGLLSAPKVMSAAAAAKLLKRWWLKQKEKESLEKEKLITDLQLLKAQMHPEILFASLEKIQLLAQRNETDKASILLLKLADILSYILYECDKAFVPLEKEIKIIKDYLVLQKTNMGNRLEMDIAVKGEPGNKMIAPLLLFTLIENCFAYIDNTNLDQNWINLEFQVEDTELTLKLIHGKTEDSSARPGGVDELASVIRNLDFYYPGNYELNRTIEPEIRMIYLKIITGGHMSKRNNIQNISEQITYATA